ncbi:MAG: crossover junction endodeoxyribonuclease RuvC [Xanthomonadales bacterium]|nr:crossover junction endodeoxyribonuclease RuvC [Xanthomonadales bacterium]
MAAATGTTRIMGIDPGSQRTGIGIVDVDALGRSRHVHHQTLVLLGNATFHLRLKQIFDELGAAIATWQPDEIAIERVFAGRNNAESALKLGQARGAAICAAAIGGQPLHEYAATAVKQAVVGRGSADKAQIQHMVGLLLGLGGRIQADAADALAIAITHAHTHGTLGRTGVSRSSWRRSR